MRFATLLIGMAGAAIAGALLLPAQGHALGEPACGSALALPHEFTGLVAARSDAPCDAALVFVPTPFTLLDISAEAMVHIWTGTMAAPNARLDRAEHLLRGAYARVSSAVTSDDARTDR